MTVKAYGASVVTSKYPAHTSGARIFTGLRRVSVIRRLTKEGKLDEEHFPSLENILRGASEYASHAHCFLQPSLTTKSH